MGVSVTDNLVLAAADTSDNSMSPAGRRGEPGDGARNASARKAETVAGQNTTY